MTNLPPLRPEIDEWCQHLAWDFADHECGGLHRGVCGLCDVKADGIRQRLDTLLRVSGPREEQKNTHGGTSLTAVDSVSAVPRDQLPHDEEDHVCGGCGKLNEDCDCDYPRDGQ